MNINNGKTGTVNIPGALHSTGGDGDGLVGNVVAYAGDVYDENLNANQAEINKSTIKLNEYNKVNVSYPTSEQMEGSILCNLVKNDEKILQDHSAWGSEFADYVRNHNVYIGTNFGNAGIEEEDFTGYIRGEEIENVMNSDDKSTIVKCFSSASDYWIVETESELIAEDNLYASTGTYTQRYTTTPFSLQADGNLFIKGVGGYNGTNSQSASTKSLQDVLNEIASASTSSSGGSVSVTSDEDWVNEVLPGAILVSGVTITAKWITDTMRGNYVYLGFEADQEVNWDLFNIDVYDRNTGQRYNRSKNDYTRIVDGCLMTELNQLSTLSGNTENISTQKIAIEGKPSFGYSYTIECDENLLNQMYDHDGYWRIDNLGNNISY